MESLSQMQLKYAYKTMKLPKSGGPMADGYFATLEELITDRLSAMASQGRNHRRHWKHYIEVWVEGSMVEVFEVG